MRKAGKILSLMVAACMALALGAFSAYADTSVPDTKWDDYAAASFAGGTGSKDDPYLIETAEQLAKISKDVSQRTVYAGSYFRLQADIDLSSHRWIPIGDYGGVNYNSFQGFLDGNGKTITGMVVDQSKDKLSAGLFGHISNSKAGNEVGVKDLTIAGAALYVDEEGMSDVSAGILVAGAMVNDGYKGTGTFENVVASGTIEVKATNGMNKIGGLIGEDNRFVVKNCKTDVNITGASNTGGMTGISANTTFENCETKGKVSGLWALGGFVGYVTSSTWDDKASESTFTQCIADVEIEASDWNAGGFVGLAEFGTFKNSASLGKVSSSVSGWESKAGGFVGGVGFDDYLENSDATFANCHSASLVTGDPVPSDAGAFAGGFVAGSFAECSYDSEKNANLSAIGKNAPSDLQIAACSTQRTLANICEDVYGGHEYAEELTVDEEPTCTEDGAQSHHCVRCDEKGEMLPIPASGHTWNANYMLDKAATCTEDGSESIHCKACDAKKDEKAIKASGHSLVWIIDKEATATEDGWKHQSCEKGDYEGDPVKIPATGVVKPLQPGDDKGVAKSPQTGDAAGVAGAFAAVAAVASAAVLVVSARQRKSRKQ